MRLIIVNQKIKRKLGKQAESIMPYILNPREKNCHKFLVWKKFLMNAARRNK